MILGNAALGLAEPSPVATDRTAIRDTAVDLPWAQAASAYRAGLVRAPVDELVLRPLAALYAMRGMNDARSAVEARLNGTSSDTDLRLTWMVSVTWPGRERPN